MNPLNAQFAEIRLTDSQFYWILGHEPTQLFLCLCLSVSRAGMKNSITFCWIRRNTWSPTHLSPTIDSFHSLVIFIIINQSLRRITSNKIHHRSQIKASATRVTSSAIRQELGRPVRIAPPARSVTRTWRSCAWYRTRRATRATWPSSRATWSRYLAPRTADCWRDKCAARTGRGCSPFSTCRRWTFARKITRVVSRRHSRTTTSNNSSICIWTRW